MYKLYIKYIRYNISNKYEGKILIRVVIVDRSLSLITYFFKKKSCIIF